MTLIAPIAPDTAATRLQPAIFICAECGSEEHMLDGALPAGWDKLQAHGRTVVRCADCNEAVEREHRAAQAVRRGIRLDNGLAPLVVDEMGWASLPHPDRNDAALSWYLYSGCRIAHWPMPGTGAVALQFLGGDTPGQGPTDDAVVFVAGRKALRALIAHLEGIDAELDGGQLVDQPEQLRQARRNVTIAMRRLDDDAAGLERLCRVLEPDEGEFLRVGEAYTASFNAFARSIEHATGVGAGEIVKRLSATGADMLRLPEQTLATCAAAQAH